MSILPQVDWVIAVLLLVFGIVAFIFSTVSGGGGALILVPTLNFLIGVSNTAPVLNLGTFIGRPARLIIFWNHIDWRVFWYYAPAATVGAWFSAQFFENLGIKWLQLIVAIFLLSTVFQYRFGQRKRSFGVKLWHFIPLGLLVSGLGTLVGALGPVLNPFYLNFGLEKEKLIATKTANSFFMGVAQIGSYSFLGLLNNQYWIYGIMLGIGAVIGNVLGKNFLSKMKSEEFRRWLILLMVASGIILLLRIFLD